MSRRSEQLRLAGMPARLSRRRRLIAACRWRAHGIDLRGQVRAVERMIRTGGKR